MPITLYTEEERQDDVMVLEENLKLVVASLEAHYTPLDFRQHVTIRSDIPPYIKSFEVERKLSMAQVSMITSEQTRFPVVTESADRARYGFFEIGGAFHITDDDLAVYANGASPGYSPTVERPQAILRATEEFLDKIAAHGSSTLGLEGLLTLTETTASAGLGLTGDWDAADSDADYLEVVADISKLIDAVPDETEDAFVANKVIFPTDVYRWLARTRFVDGDRKTVLALLQETHPGVQFTQWRRANTVPGVSGGRVAVIGGANPWMAVPRFMEFGKIIHNHAGYEQAIRTKFGGVFTPHAQSIVYYDNPFAI